MRLGTIIAHLLNNDEELLAILHGQASLLNVDEEELEAIIQVLIYNPKSFMEEI